VVIRDAVQVLDAGDDDLFFIGRAVAVRVAEGSHLVLLRLRDVDCAVVTDRYHSRVRQAPRKNVHFKTLGEVQVVQQVFAERNTLRHEAGAVDLDRARARTRPALLGEHPGRDGAEDDQGGREYEEVPYTFHLNTPH